MILLFDRDENLIKTIKPKELIHTEELNGVNFINISTVEPLEKYQRVVFRDENNFWQEFIVEEVSHRHGSNEAYAEHSFYELIGDPIEDKRPNGTASFALGVALEPTRWEVGTVENFGTAKLNFYQISSKEALTQIIKTYGCDLRPRIEVAGTEITHRYIDLIRRGEDEGKRFTYKKDILDIERIITKDKIITALYGYGKGEELDSGGFGRRLTFKEVNGGKAYITNEAARLKWGRGKEKAHIFGKVIFPNTTDPAELLQLTQEELERVSQPNAVYKTMVEDLKGYGFTHEGTGVGDKVIVIDDDLEIELSARVLKLTTNILRPSIKKVEIGRYKNFADGQLSQEETLANLDSKSGVWDRADILDEDGLDANYLKNLIEEINDKLNMSGGYVFMEPGEGIITFNHPDEAQANEATQILAGGIRIADGKLPNGEWNWRTFSTGKGMVADAIHTGLLKGGKVQWNLDDGSFLIGNSPSDYDLLWTGSELKIKGDNIDLSMNQGLNIFIGEEIEDYVNENKESLKGDPGADAPIWTIGNDGFWYKNGVKQPDKAIGTDADNWEVGNDGFWYKNGTKTNKKAVGDDAPIWSIGSDGFWYKDGVKQPNKAIGDDADVWEIGEDGYWYLNGTKTDKRALGRDGEDAPVWSIGNDGFWYKDGVKQSEKAIGEDGDDWSIGEDGYWYKNGEKTEDRAEGLNAPDKYTWIVYAPNDEPNALEISTDPSGMRYVGIAANKTDPIHSSDYTDYKWSPLYDNAVTMGTTAPSDPHPAQLWVDTSARPNQLKKWNADEERWVIINDTDGLKNALETLPTASDVAGWIAEADLTEFVNDKVDGAVNDLEVEIQNAKDAAANADDKAQGIEDKLGVYFSFDEDGLRIKTKDGRYSMLLSNKELGFYDRGTKVAWLNNSKLFVGETEVTKADRWGKFAFIPNTDGSLSLKKVDD